MKISLFVCSMLLIFGCSKVPQKNIIIYGSNNCPHCVSFKASLNNDGYTYTFHDVDKDDDLVQEMMDVVTASGHKGRILYPVVVLEDSVYVAPKYEEIKVLL